MMPVLFLLTLSACAQPRKYYQVPGVVAKTWEPTTNQVQQALSSVEQYCKLELSDTVREIKRARTEAEVETIVSNDTITISFDPPKLDTNSIPSNFKVYGVPYPQFKKRIGPFVEDRASTQARFIAVQHLLSPEIRKTVKDSRPFTVYYLIDTGEIGLNTRMGYDKETVVPIMYSPGPPYYISTARF